MKTFRNSHKRSRYRNNDRNFKRNGDINKYSSDFPSNINFQRKAPGRNNHNASKLIDKYNDLAREALSNGDKILSENYFQHADHFMRIFKDQENSKIIKIPEEKNRSDTEVLTKNNKETDNQNIEN